MFPQDFVWGVATSAYQIEGKDPADGAGECVWDTFVKNGKIFDGHTADVACDHMHWYRSVMESNGLVLSCNDNCRENSAKR